MKELLEEQFISEFTRRIKDLASASFTPFYDSSKQEILTQLIELTMRDLRDEFNMGYFIQSRNPRLHAESRFAVYNVYTPDFKTTASFFINSINSKGTVSLYVTLDCPYKTYRSDNFLLLLK